jgi:hypothetical protein
MEEHLVKELLSSVECAVCGQNYETPNIRILYRQQDLWLISVFCDRCRTKGLVAALIRQSQVAEVITDFTEEEMAKLKDTSPVTADDVLDVHNFLEGFNGDFASLFSKSPPER